MLMKAQVATEYVLIIGVLLFITIPIFYYALSESKESTRVNQAYDSVNMVAKTADSVYALGAGNKRYVWVNVPEGVVSTYLQDHTIAITLSAFGSNSDFVALTSANVTGTLPTGQGRYRISVEMLDSGIVQIGQ